MLLESSSQVEDGTKLEVSLLSPDFAGNDQELILKQIAPKRYSTELKDINPGTYNLKITRIKDGKIVDMKTKGLLVPEKIVSTPLEYAVQGN
jgi:hypothetical protein